MPVRDLNDLYYFAQVVDHGGFAPAGRALGVPKSKLSRRIALLEESLGVRLIQRSTRRFSVTDIGQEYYRHCMAMLVEAEAAQEAVERSRSEPCGVVNLSCPIALLHARVGSMLATFMAVNPRVEIHLDATNRRVDVLQEGVDIAIRVRFPPLEDTDLVLKVLGKRRQSLVVSPVLLARLGTPEVPADLSAFPSLDLGPARREHTWQLYGPEEAAASIHHRPRLVSDDMMTLRLAAQANVGIVQLPTMIVGNDLTQGSLVELLPSWSPRCGIVHAVFPSRRGLLPSVRALLDHLAAEFEALAAHEA